MSKEDSKPENTEKPDFKEWLKTKDGQDCLIWPISEVKYLENRLFWAFDAGRDRIWDQYLKVKNEKSDLESQLAKAKAHLEGCKMIFDKLGYRETSNRIESFLKS